MARWVAVYEGRDEHRYEDLKAMLDNAKIKYRAKGVNAEHPAGSGGVGRFAETRAGLIQPGTMYVSEMSEPVWRYTIEIRTDDYDDYRAALTEQK